MKKLICISFLLCLAVPGNSQVNNKPKLNELNLDQLNLALAKSKKAITAGKILTFTGLGLFTTGAIMLMAEGVKALDENSDASKAWTGYYTFLIGGTVTWIGIPVWIVGGSRKHKIELQLVKYNSPGTASINGIGLNMKF